MLAILQSRLCSYLFHSTEHKSLTIITKHLIRKFLCCLYLHVHRFFKLFSEVQQIKCYYADSFDLKMSLKNKWVGGWDGVNAAKKIPRMSEDCA